jgi:hypothetical protein
MAEKNPAQTQTAEISDAARKLSEMRQVRSGGTNGGRGESSAEARKYKRALTNLTDAVLIYLHQKDGLLMKEKSIPRELSANLGKISTYLDMENDRARFFALGIDYRKDNKGAATAAAYRRKHQ